MISSGHKKRLEKLEQMSIKLLLHVDVVPAKILAQVLNAAVKGQINKARSFDLALLIYV